MSFEEIHEANLITHRLEAPIYDVRHPEIFNKREQKRTMQTLKRADSLIDNNNRTALDLGAGTGNITSKLLRLGFTVSTLDISPEMCQQITNRFRDYIETGQLSVINTSFENLSKESQYDIVTCYSVLHHLPDYLGTIKKIASILHKGGVMYLDHEASPYYWHRNKRSFFNRVYRKTDIGINAVYYKINRYEFPQELNFDMSDYWDKDFRHLDYSKIDKEIICSFSFLECIDYYVKQTWLPNPLFFIYRVVNPPTTRCWIAKK